MGPYSVIRVGIDVGNLDAEIQGGLCNYAK